MNRKLIGTLMIGMSAMAVCGGSVAEAFGAEISGVKISYSDQRIMVEFDLPGGGTASTGTVDLSVQIPGHSAVDSTVSMKVSCVPNGSCSATGETPYALQGDAVSLKKSYSAGLDWLKIAMKQPAAKRTFKGEQMKPFPRSKSAEIGAGVEVEDAVKSIGDGKSILDPEPTPCPLEPKGYKRR